MTKSILKTASDVCYICRRRCPTHLHHIFEGFNRRKSDINGFTVYLCPDCHLYGEEAVHRCRETDLKLKARCQRVYEKTHTRKEFTDIIGKNYL